MADQTSGVSRRRVIQGAAWATPAILVASAAPALAVSGAAASVSGSYTIGHKHIIYPLSLTASTALAGALTLTVTTSKSGSSASGSGSGWSGPTGTSVHVFTHGASVPSGGSFNISVTLSWGDNALGGTSTTFVLRDVDGDIVGSTTINVP